MSGVTVYLFFPKLTENCPNVSHCPHLGGALGAVVHSANANDEGLQSLLRQIDALREENSGKARISADQQARIEQLERALDPLDRDTGQAVDELLTTAHRHLVEGGR